MRLGGGYKSWNAQGALSKAWQQRFLGLESKEKIAVGENSRTKGIETESLIRSPCLLLSQHLPGKMLGRTRAEQAV